MIYDIKGETDHRQISAEVHADTPAADFYDWRTVSVYIHRFANVEYEVGENYAEQCPNFWCFGHEWNLEHKWSVDGVDGDDVNISIHLHHRSTTPVRLYYVIAARSFDKYITIGEENALFNSGIKSRLVGVINRDIAMDNLVGGALVLEVQMRKPLNYKPPAFIPVNPSACRTIQDMFMDDETSDVTFEVGGEREMDESGAKVMKTEPTKFYAHLVILKKCAPVLANMRNSNAPSDTINLPSVSPEIFNHLLEYIYCRESADFADTLKAKEVLEAADRYGVAYLKLKAEAYYVSSIEVTFDNVMENLQYAESMNCALLKEVVMDFIAKNRDEIIRRQIMKDAPGGLINDVLAATIRVENKEESADADDFNAMSINEIRRKAQEKGLDVDGSRESLISSLLALEVE